MMSLIWENIVAFIAILVVNLSVLVAQPQMLFQGKTLIQAKSVSESVALNSEKASIPSVVGEVTSTPSIPVTQIIRHYTQVPTVPWGTTEKLAEHTYRTYVGEDDVMSTPDELVEALNKYRRNHGSQELFVSDMLCRLADMRIAQLDEIGGLDAHKGFKEYLSIDKNWENIPTFKSVGENNSYGYKLSGTHLIEWVFDADEEHRSNQQNPKWNRVCTRISDTIVEIIFGEER